MSKKQESTKAGAEKGRLLEMAEAFYRFGNFNEARALAHRLLKSSESTPGIIKQSNNILAMTRIDLPSLAIGVLSLIFTGVVAIISAY